MGGEGGRGRGGGGGLLLKGTPVALARWPVWPGDSVLMLAAAMVMPEDGTPVGSDTVTRGVVEGVLTGGGRETEFWMVVV